MEAIVGVSVNPEIIYAGLEPLNGQEKSDPVATRTGIAGSSVNVARMLAAWEWRCHVVGAVGRKDHGVIINIADDLAMHGIEATLLPLRPQTPIATVLNFRDGTRRMFSSKPSVDGELPCEQLMRVREWAWSERRPWRVFTGVRPDEVPVLQALMAPGDEVRTALIPNRALIQAWGDGRGLLPFTVLCLGHDEIDTFGFPTKYLPTLFASHPHLQLIIATAREDGMVAWTRGGIMAVQSAIDPRLPICDTTGCGDAVLGTVLAHVCDEHGALVLTDAVLKRALRAAAAAAALKATRLGGSSVPTRAEVEALLAKSHTGGV